MVLRVADARRVQRLHAALGKVGGLKEVAQQAVEGGDYFVVMLQRDADALRESIVTSLSTQVHRQALRAACNAALKSDSASEVTAAAAEARATMERYCVSPSDVFEGVMGIVEKYT